MPTDTKRFRFDVFSSPWLLASLFLLILNDYCLKAEFHNWLTGKLSDFSGLFLFSLFWFAFFPARTLHVVAATAAAFAFWKSPLSQPLIDIWNGGMTIQIARTVDYTDLLALSALPLARLHFLALRPRPVKEAIIIPALALSLFAITGTSVAPKSHMVKFEMQRVDGAADAPPVDAHPWSMGLKDPNFVAVNEKVAAVALKHGLTCQNCDSQGTRRRYSGDRLSIDTNYNFTHRTVFIKIYGYLPEEAPRDARSALPAEEELLKKTENIRSEVMAALGPDFKNATFARQSFLLPNYEYRTISVTAADIVFPLFQGRYFIGKENEKLKVVADVLYDFIRDYIHEDRSMTICMQERDPCRHFDFGEAIHAGGSSQSNYIKLRATHKFPKEAATLQITVGQSLSGGVLDLDKSVEGLAEKLREKLPKDTSVEVGAREVGRVGFPFTPL